jgi:hypothetical protein
MWPQTMVVRALEDVDVTVFGLEYYPKHPSSVRALHQLDSSLLILPILELQIIELMHRGKIRSE